jgi:hypothetical protein
MRLHREGTPTLLLVAAVTCFVLFATHRWLPSWAAITVSAAMVGVLAIVLWFFRVPARTPLGDDGAICSPCDGKVVAIEEVHEPEYFKDKRRQVSIFMSPLNVHINYYPVNGTTSYYKYHPGKYLVAWHPKSSTENERSTVVVKHPRMATCCSARSPGAGPPHLHLQRTRRGRHPGHRVRLHQVRFARGPVPAAEHTHSRSLRGQSAGCHHRDRPLRPDRLNHALHHHRDLSFSPVPGLRT